MGSRERGSRERGRERGSRERGSRERGSRERGSRDEVKVHPSKGRMVPSVLNNVVRVDCRGWETGVWSIIYREKQKNNKEKFL